MKDSLKNETTHSLEFCLNLLKQLPGLIVVMDLNSKFIYSNNHTANLFGYQKEKDIIGLNAYGMRCPAVESADDFIKQDQLVLKTNQTLTILDIHQYAIGEPKILLTKKAPYREDEKIAGTICLCTEISSETFAQTCSILTDSDKKYYNKKNKTNRSYTLATPFNSNLTEREMECIFHLLRGKTMKMIGQALDLSPRTVEFYLENIKTKLNCSSKADIVEHALSKGYLNYIPRNILSQDLSSILC